MADDQQDISLNRTISLPFLIFYGLGTMIGGGIYAVTGKVADVAGMYAPIAFALSALLALITAFSYAELATRFPYSAGEVRYISAAFKKRTFSIVIGWLVVFMGAVSAAALSTATAGFIYDLAELPTLPVTFAIVLILGLIAAKGITESVALVTLITLIEIGGLILIIYAGWDHLMTINNRWTELVPQADLYDLALWSSILSATFLSFYAFIGFEDMVNVAEEVKDVRKNMPIAIIVCIITTLVIYILVSTVAVLTVAPNILGQSNTPLAVIMENTSYNIHPSILILISILATINGVLVQMIMGARVLYGMAHGKEAPFIFGRVHPATKTPLAATLFVVLCVLVLALLFDLVILAKVTSGIILFVFTAVNASLLKLKWTERQKQTEHFNVHWIIPLIGFFVCLGMLTLELIRIAGATLG